jgi:hypothetical protein
MRETNEAPDTDARSPNRKLIFVSYSSADQNSAERLVRQIEAIGIPCWMAPRDVPFGANYGKAILDAIESAEVVVVLLSANANKSIHVANEIERAASYRKTIVPLRLENVRPSREIELHISSRQWVDLFEGQQQREQNMRRFLDVLRDVLRSWLVPDLPPLGHALPTPPVEPVVASLPDRGRGMRSTQLGPPVAGPAVSNPELRKAIASELKKASNGSSLGAAIYRAYGAPLIPEMCLMSREQEFQGPTLYQCIGFCAVQPTARPFANLVLETMIEMLPKGWWHLSGAVQVIKTLPISRSEKWRSLFDLYSAVHLANGEELVRALVETAPPEHRPELCAALAETLHIPSRAVQTAAINGIRRFSYRAGIPDLRDLTETSSDAYIAARAAECLAEWRDVESAPSIRLAIEACDDAASWISLATCLRKLQGSTAADFLVQQLGNLPEDAQRHVLTYCIEEFRDSKLAIGFLEKLAREAVDPGLRQTAESRLSELSPT